MTRAISKSKVAPAVLAGLLAMLSPASAQEEIHCRDLFATPHFQQMPVWLEEGTYGGFRDNELAELLVGIPCSAEDATQYMVGSGWATAGRFEVPEPDVSKFDFVLYFCDVRAFPFRLLSRCRGSSVIGFYQGRIVHFLMGPDVL